MYLRIFCIRITTYRFYRKPTIKPNKISNGVAEGVQPVHMHRAHTHKGPKKKFLCNRFAKERTVICDVRRFLRGSGHPASNPTSIAVFQPSSIPQSSIPRLSRFHSPHPCLRPCRLSPPSRFRHIRY